MSKYCSSGDHFFSFNKVWDTSTLILPHMEKQGLYDSIDLTKPWDDPANADKLETVLNVYLCPSAVIESNMTTYHGAFGPDCVFSGSEPRKRSDITDKVSETIAVIEVSSDQAVHWMSPHDIPRDEVPGIKPEVHTGHPGITVAAFLDGHVSFIPLEIKPEVLQALLTINGGEEVDPDEY